MRCCARQILAAVLLIAGAAAAGCGAGAAGGNAEPGVGMAGRMAFVMRQGPVAHIYLLDIDAAGMGANPTRLTNDAEPENYPSWSPDGQRLVYQRDFNGSAIYVIGADGSGQRRLSPTPGFDVTPSWSPDGTKIVYARLHAAPQPNKPPLTDIRVMNADGRAITPSWQIPSLAWNRGGLSRTSRCL